VQQDDSRLRRVPGLAVKESKATTSAVSKYISYFSSLPQIISTRCIYLRFRASREKQVIPCRKATEQRCQ